MLSSAEENEWAREVVSDAFSELLAVEVLTARFRGESEEFISAALKRGFEAAKAEAGEGDDFDAFHELTLRKLNARIDEYRSRIWIPENPLTLH